MCRVPWSPPIGVYSIIDDTSKPSPSTSLTVGHTMYFWCWRKLPHEKVRKDLHVKCGSASQDLSNSVGIFIVFWFHLHHVSLLFSHKFFNLWSNTNNTQNVSLLCMQMFQHLMALGHLQAQWWLQNKTWYWKLFPKIIILESQEPDYKIQFLMNKEYTMK